MKKSLRYLFLFNVLLLSLNSLQATHNRAGEIIIEQIGDCDDLMVKATIITYTKASSIAADRDTLTICWGDGFCEQVARANGPGNPPSGVEIGNDVKFNIYCAFHTYPARGTYTISMTDPNRNGGVLNVNPPGSDNVQFHLETTYTFLNTQFQGCNDTPRLLQPPVDFACIGEKFIHNPNAFDPDGDSLSYELVVPLQDVNMPVPNYILPQNVSGNDPLSPVTLDPSTGDLCWLNPQTEGEYNVAMIIISWRNGIPIDTVLRDMQIFVEDCDDNQPPIIEVEDEFCVIAGEKLDFNVTAWDPDGDQIKLSALGGPFILDISPASDFESVWSPFINPPGSLGSIYTDGPVTRTFSWQTACEHIREQPYNIVFKVVDNVFDTSGLAVLKSVKIKVVGPPPIDPRAEPTSDFVEVSWELPYVCEGAADDYFYGFSVWRREGNNQFPIDECKPGLDGQGYEQIEPRTEEIMDGRYFFLDDEVERGRTYCYRILAQFALITTAGQPYNLVESLPSEEICVQLSRDVPLITNVSVDETDPDTGEIFVRWTKPVVEDLDTILNPGPYLYELHRIRDGSDPLLIFSATSETYAGANDTTFTDTGLNTEDEPYSYQISFYVNNETEPLGFSPRASSIFLNVASTDEINNLSWDFDTPWNNYEYHIFRQNNSGGWDSIGLSNEPAFSDKGLINGKEYCYYVKAFGSFGVDGVPSPLINLSQENCGIPLDTIPPCPPRLSVSNLCDENISCQDGPNFENSLTWENPMNLCPETDDVVSYNIYYAATENADFELIASIDRSDDTTFIHEPFEGIAGCYAVTALDTFFNESRFSNIFCVDNCPNYDLPNAFTPNADSQNDLFVPYPYCFIDHVEFNVFNRWGQVVFTTEDPNLNWDGTNLQGKELPEGTYYYTCRVFESRVAGVIEAPDILRGYIELIRGSN